MKINVRHEEATEAGSPEGSEATPERACVWVVGDDGETTDTEYLAPGEKVSIDVATSAEVHQQATVSEVGPIAEQPPINGAEEPDGGSPAETEGGGDTEPEAPVA